MLLSICIPTYNRSEFLEKTLLSIVEAQRFEEMCEVVISDNNSSDNTREVVSKFSDKYRNIRYINNESNVGADQNFIKVLNLGNGKYLKLHSDKTLFCKDKLDALLAYLTEIDLPTIFLLNSGRNYLGNNLIVCKDLNEFVSIVSFMSTWMSGAIYKRSEYLKIADYENKIGLSLIQTYLLLRIVSDQHRSVVITDKLMQDIDVEKGGYNLFKVFICNYLSLYEEFINKSALSANTYNIEKKRLLVNFVFPWYTQTILLKNKKFKFDTKNTYKHIFKYYKLEIRLYLYPFYLIKALLSRLIVRLRGILVCNYKESGNA